MPPSTRLAQHAAMEAVVHPGRGGSSRGFCGYLLAAAQALQGKTLASPMPTRNHLRPAPHRHAHPAHAAAREGVAEWQGDDRARTPWKARSNRQGESRRRQWSSRAETSCWQLAKGPAFLGSKPPGPTTARTAWPIHGGVDRGAGSGGGRIARSGCDIAGRDAGATLEKSNVGLGALHDLRRHRQMIDASAVRGSAPPHI